MANTAANALGAQQIADFLDRTGRAEKKRQEQQTLRRISDVLSSGRDVTINDIVQAASAEPDFAPGLGGFSQRFGSENIRDGGRIGQDIQSGVISDRLQELLSTRGFTPNERLKARKVKARIEPGASAALTELQVQAKKEKEKSAVRVKFDRNIKVIEDKKATVVQKERSRIRLGELDLPNRDPGDDFSVFLKGQKTEFIEGGFALDKGFGKKAYNKALTEAVDDGLGQGFNRESTTEEFDKWWDAQAKAERDRGDKRFKFIPRSEFMSVEPQGFGLRNDGVTQKGTGFLGELQVKGGGVATEFTTQSNAVKVDGERIDFPSLVPTLTKAEVKQMTGDIIPNRKNIPEPIMRKAIDHANKRLAAGKSVFIDEGVEAPVETEKATVQDLLQRGPPVQPTILQQPGETKELLLDDIPGMTNDELLKIIQGK